DHVGRGGDVDDRHEVVDRVVRNLLVDGRVGGRGGHRGHAEGVAVGGGAHHFGGADHAAAASLVFDHHGLPQRLAQRVGDGAGDDVGGAAGCERHHQANRLAGVGLRAHRAGGQGGSGENDPLTSLHGGPVPLSG